jgi:hypothetical protein
MMPTSLQLLQSIWQETLLQKLKLIYKHKARFWLGLTKSDCTWKMNIRVGTEKMVNVCIGTNAVNFKLMFM